MYRIMKDIHVNLDELAEKGELIEDCNGHYRVKNKYTGDLVPAEQFLTAPCGIDFHFYVRKTSQDTLYYHPNQERVAEHKDLWPGRHLDVLFFEGAKIWAKAAVGCFKASINSGRGNDAGQNDPSFETSTTIQYSLLLNFNQDGDLKEGAVVELKGLKGQQYLNGKIAVVTRKVMSVGRYPVQFWDKSRTEGSLRTISVKPENMKLRNRMLFDVHRICVDSGGVLVPAESLPKAPRLSFKWTERLPSEHSTWFFVTDPPDAAWRKPFDPESNESVEALKHVYEQQLDKCLQQDDKDTVAREIDKMKDRLIESVVTLTTYGSPDGLRAALRDLLAMPVAMVILAEKELVHRFDNCHILQLMAAAYLELGTYTDQFGKESFDQRYTVVYARAGIKSTLDLRLWSHGCYFEILKQYYRMGEYRAALSCCHECLRRHDLIRLMSQRRDLFDFRTFLECRLTLFFKGRQFIRRSDSAIVENEKDEWRSTAGDFSLQLSLPERIYSPGRPRSTSTSREDDADEEEHECVNCGKLGAPYTCADCQVPRFCGRECQLLYWQQVHIDECGGPPKLGEKCVVCDKATDVACMACLDVYYCSDKCHAIDWERGHKDSCRGE